jgi:hypothetical protein
MGERRTKSFAVKLSQGEYAKLQSLARITHVSEADVMRLLILNGGPELVMQVPREVKRPRLQPVNPR